MVKRLNRRQLLRAGALTGVGVLAAACTPNSSPSQPQSQPPAPLPAQAQPTQQSATAAVANMPIPQATAILSSTPVPAQPGPTAVTTTAVDNTATLVTAMAGAASQFLIGLDEAQRTKATYVFADTAERTRWHWTTPGGFPRNGLPLRDMAKDQRDAALALLQASVSDKGFTKALNIMTLQNDLGNDPELYYVTVFGTPDSAGSSQPWSWRLEGHHYSRHFTVAGDKVTMTPFFLGAWPTVNNAGLKAMEREEWAARELITSLQTPQRDAAIFQGNTLTRHVTQNAATVQPLDAVGLPVSDLNAEQQVLVMEIITTYLGTLPAQLAQAHLDKLNAAGAEKIRFGWAGSLDARRPHYYRLQGPTFLLEHDNSRNGGTHIHSVWRDFAEDFGQNLTPLQPA